jgi:p24 family protein beta-1
MIWAILLGMTIPSQGVPGHDPLDVNAEEENLDLSREWDEHIQGFSPEDLLRFEIGALGEEEFFEAIDIVPSIVRGAWFVSTAESRDIDFTILDPSQIVLFERKSRKEVIFSFEAKRQGVYVFRFKNNRIMQGHTITLALHCGNSSNTVLTSEHLSPVEQQLSTIQKSIKDFQLDSQFAQLRQETHYNTVAGANKNVFWFSLLESMGVVAVTAWQIYYIKKLLDNRRVI